MTPTFAAIAYLEANETASRGAYKPTHTDWNKDDEIALRRGVAASQLGVKLESKVAAAEDLGVDELWEIADSWLRGDDMKEVFKGC